MTNEEILIIFLKEHERYESFKHQRVHRLPTYINVYRAIDITLHWHATGEGTRYWEELNIKWYNLCKDFKLQGKINIYNL